MLAAALLWLALAAVPNAARLVRVGGYTLSVRDGRLMIHRGRDVAPLPGIRSASALGAARLAGGKIALRYEDACGVEQSLSLSPATLDALLANAAGMRAYRKGELGEATSRFSRALALDPQLDVAATNLASAEARLGRTGPALAALAPLLLTRQFATYAKIVGDPDLAHLRGTAPIAALLARDVGSPALSLSRQGAVELPLARSGLLLAPERGWLAALLFERAWGSCSFSADVVVHDARTGQPVGALSVVAVGEAEPDCARPGVREAARARVESRLAVANSVLVDFGFRPIRATEHAAIDGRADQRLRARFEKAAIDVEVRQGRLRALRKGALVRELVVSPPSAIDRAVYLADPPVIVLGWSRAGREGCEGSDPAGIVVLPLPTAP